MDKRIVLASGLTVSILGGAIAGMAVGLIPGLILTTLFVWTFGLAFGANVALTAILRGPQAPWKALMPGLLCFAPIFLGVFPTGNWMSMSRFSEGRMPLSLYGIPLVLCLGGLIVPNGFFIDGIKRLRTPRV